MRLDVPHGSASRRGLASPGAFDHGKGSVNEMGVKLKPQTLYRKFPSRDVASILSQDRCELDNDFAGFIDEYETLSKIIPQHFTVIDFGCNLAAQCWFFRNHERYIGVDTIGMKRFRCPNTTHAVMDIQQWIKKYADRQPESTFAICNYVPDDTAVKMVRECFPRLFCFYPAGTSPMFW